MYDAASPNVNLLVEFKVKPVPSVCVKRVSWSLPNLIIPPSAKNKSLHSAEAEPNACPSAELGTLLPKPLAVPLFVIEGDPAEPSDIDKYQQVLQCH